MLINIAIIVVLLVIVGSLFSALFFLVKDKGKGSDRTVKALTVRVGLSITLFVVLLLSYHFGYIGHTPV